MSRRCWTPLGPNSAYDRKLNVVVSGPFNAITADRTDLTGKTIYAGSARGGLWRTSDAGVTWRSVSDTLSSLAIGAIVVTETTDGKFLFVGTGDRRGRPPRDGVGVFLSSDDGITFDPLPPFDSDPTQNKNPLFGKRVNAIAVQHDQPGVDPGFSSLVWVGTNRGLFKSVGRGSAWVQAEDGDWTSFARSAGHVIGARTGSGLFRENFGTFQKVLDVSGGMGRVVVAEAPSDSQIFYAAFANEVGTLQRLFRSGDGGVAWGELKLPKGGISTSDENLFLAVHPTDPDRVYVGADGLWHSFDGGSTIQGWNKINGDVDGQIRALAFTRAPHRDAWVAASDGVYVSPTEVERRAPPTPTSPNAAPAPQKGVWETRVRGLGTLEVFGLAQHPKERSVLLGAGGRQGALRYRGHPFWSETEAFPIFHVAIDPKDPTIWYATGTFLDGLGGVGVLQSVDSGKTWRPIGNEGISRADLANETDFSEICPLALDASRKGIVYFGTEHLYRWDNSESSAGWALMVRSDEFKVDESPRASPITAIAVAPSNPRIVYAGTRAGTLLRLEEVQGVFKPVQKTFQFGRGTVPGDFSAISSIAVHPDDDATLYVTTRRATLLQAGGTDRLRWLFRSKDGGQIWEDLPLDLVPEPPDTQTVPPETLRVNKVFLEQNAPFRIFLATDIGVLASRHDPQVQPLWRNIRHNLPNVEVSDVASFPPGPVVPTTQPRAGRALRIATIGRGVWERFMPDSDDVAAEDCAGAEFYVRDNLLDTGETITFPASFSDPIGDLDSDGNVQTITATDAVDLKVDLPDSEGFFQKPFSTTQYLPADPNITPDYIGFELLAREQLQADVELRTYLQVHNRGPTAARAKVRLLFSRNDGATLTQFPTDPFETFAPDTGWFPAGDVQTAEVRPAEPLVMRFDWRLPRDVKENAFVAAVVSGLPNEGDVLGPLPDEDAEALATDERRILLRQFSVLAPPPLQHQKKGFFRWWMVPAALGVAYLIVDLADFKPVDKLDLL